MMCPLCGVTPDDPDVHSAWHSTLAVTPAGLEHAARQADAAYKLLKRIDAAGVE